MRVPISVEKRVGVFLYYIVDEGRLRKTANAFGIAKSTTSKVIREVSTAISVNMSHFIKLPQTEEEVIELKTRFFQAHGFPQCIGAIDGTHIGIAKPKDNPTSYINKASNFSLNIQAVCDYRYRFLDVVIRWPGSVHDARIFSNSIINRKMASGTIPRCPAVIVPNEQAVPVCLLADPAYPLLPHVMKEFVGGGQTMQEQFYGYRLSSARMTIECAFGRLKGRFGCLRRNMDINMKDLPRLVHACFIMHNFCETRNNSLPEVLVEEAQTYDRRFQPQAFVPQSQNHSNNTEAKLIRSVFVKYFE
jgi:hypothetical protein